MYHQIYASEMFRERQRALLEEAESRRLARQLRAGRTSKARSTTGGGGLAAVALGFLAALLLASLLVVAAGPAEAAGKYRTVTKTFSNASAITIPISGAASPYPSQVAAGGMRRGKILDVNVALRNFSHSFPDDVDVMLAGPRGQNAIIMSDVGDLHDVNNLTLTLDDESANSLSDNGPLVNGTFKPTNIDTGDTFTAPAPAPSGAVALSTFDGSNPNGPWSLYVVDDTSGDMGQLAGGWSLQIRARVLR